MQLRWITALAGGLTGALVVGAEIARAQENSGGTIDLGGSIAGTVNDAVSSASGSSSGGTVVGSTHVEHNEISLGDQQGLAISDASGGNQNVSFVS
jgi:hypothetical protein